MLHTYRSARSLILLQILQPFAEVNSTPNWDSVEGQWFIFSCTYHLIHGIYYKCVLFIVLEIKTISRGLTRSER